LDDEFEGHHLPPVDVCLFEQLKCGFRDISVQLLEVFHLAQQSHQNRIEVHLQKAVLLALAALVVRDEEVFQLLVGALVDLLLPKANLGLLVILDDFQDVLVELVGILVLLSFGDSLAEGVYLLERFRDTVFEGSAPCESAGDGWVVVVDW